MEETGNRFKPISMSYVLLLSQYYRWIKEKRSMESLDELRHWVTEEAEYQHPKLSMVCPVLEMHKERAQPTLRDRRRET